MPTTALSEEIIREMLHQNSQRIALETQNLSLKEKEIDRNAAQASEAMKLQAEDLKDQRRYDLKKQQNLYFAVGAGVLVLAFLVGYSLHVGKEQFGQEILKTVVPPIMTGFTGYWAGRAKKTSGNASPEK